MENIRIIFLYIFGVFWAVVQLILTIFILCIFTLWASTVQLLRLGLHNKFYLATIFWGFGCKLIIRVGLLCKPYLIDRRSQPYRSNLPRALYICNHKSIWDIPLVISNYQIVPIMKKELLGIPLFGLIARASTVIPVDRKDPLSRTQVVKEVQKRLNENLPIQFYPEGTRSKTSEPKAYKDIKSTLLMLAYKENVTVVPTAIWGTDNINSKWGLTKFPVRLGLIVQKELYPKDFPDEESFAKACWEQVLAAYAELNLALMKTN